MEEEMALAEEQLRARREEQERRNPLGSARCVMPLPAHACVEDPSFPVGVLVQEKIVFSINCPCPL